MESKHTGHRDAIAAWLVLPVVVVAAAFGREPAYDGIWKDPEIEQRIRTGIQANRMGFATLRFTGPEDAPVTGVEVEFEQVTHDFLFGCNIFSLGGFGSAQQNRRYEEAFASLFNLAIAPFYWSDLEPGPGRVRFEKESPPVPRRPPPDRVLDFCRRHHILVKGHPLIWHNYFPPWAPKDRKEVTRLLRKRFGEIAVRYGGEIPIWDVVNEPLERRPEDVLPEDYVFWSMKEAERVFPPGARLAVNEVTSHWSEFRRETSPFYLLLQNLLLRGARVDIIGFQFHLFSEQGYARLLAGASLRPADLYRVLDQYADFARPIHISEITIPALPASPAGDEDQAAVVRNLYRLWFSHPRVEAIVWWNLADGTALARENRWRGGLLREDLQPKPSFQVLESLIRKEWRTAVRANTGSGSELRVQGYYGSYRLRARREKQTVEREVHLSKTGINEFEVRFPQAEGAAGSGPPARSDSPARAVAESRGAAPPASR
jgi:GH35 family endo-1,4-beta-xylanase